jgi:HEPN domain-containing protein
VAEPKAHRVERSKARTYLGKADEFLAAAKTALAAEQNDAALLLAIHAGISACDAVTVALGGLRSTDPDHLRAADLLETVARLSDEVKDRSDQLRSLLKLKNLVEYEDRRVSAKEADTGTRRAERLVGWATAQVARART